MKKNRCVFVLGNQVRAARRAQHIEQSALAAEVGITTAGLRLIEYNQSDPAFSTVAALAKRLGLSLDALAERRDAGQIEASIPGVRCVRCQDERGTGRAVESTVG